MGVGNARCNIRCCGISKNLFLLSLYLRSAPSFNLIYGSVGAILVLMLRLYLMGLIILIGPEIHNEIENAPGDRLLKRRSQSVLSGSIWRRRLVAKPSGQPLCRRKSRTLQVECFSLSN